VPAHRPGEKKLLLRSVRVKPASVVDPTSAVWTTYTYGLPLGSGATTASHRLSCTARPMTAWAKRPLAPKEARAGSLPGEAVNGAAHGRRGVVPGCPLGTGPDRCEWHAGGTAGEDDASRRWRRWLQPRGRTPRRPAAVQPAAGRSRRPSAVSERRLGASRSCGTFVRPTPRSSATPPGSSVSNTRPGSSMRPCTTDAPTPGTSTTAIRSCTCGMRPAPFGRSTPAAAPELDEEAPPGRGAGGGPRVPHHPAETGIRADVIITACRC